MNFGLSTTEKHSKFARTRWRKLRIENLETIMDELFQ